jgi:protein O-mannosyl-transferase
MSNAPELTDGPKPLSARREHWPRLVGGVVLIVLAAFAVYWQALSGPFLWDDFLVVHRNPLVTGEWAPMAIWFRMDFPLTYFAFWLQWLAWGNHPAGYHVVNVLLHATSALLLWRLLAQLRVPGPWLAAMIFAVHPVCVASVAWISELKNTLSLPFFLLSLLWYLQLDSAPRLSPLAPRPTLRYCLSLLAFLLALLSKTSTVMLPFVMVGCAWWQRERITSRDCWRASPFFVLALAFGFMSVWFQSHGAITGATVQNENFFGRLAGAGMALWFYLGKALLPLNLCMIYPRWTIDAAAPVSYLPLLLWCGVLVVCWGWRRTWGRHLLFGLGCFTLTLFPVLGFFDMYFLMLSRVSDHFDYLPLTALVALAAGGLGYTYSRLVPSPKGPAPRPLADSSARSAMFIATTPPDNQAPSGAACAPPPSYEPFVPLLPHEHPAPDETAPSARCSRSSLLPRRALALLLATALVVTLAILAAQRSQVFQSEEALWRDTLSKNPSAWCAHANLGRLLAEHQNYDEARTHLVKSLELYPDNAQAHSNLGRLLSLQRQFAESETHFQTALTLKPKDADIRKSYASALAEQGRLAEAVQQLRETLRLRPDLDARLQLGALLYQSHRFPEAAAEYRQVLAVKPDHLEALNNLSWLLATCSDQTVRDGPEAVRLAEHACRLSGYQQPRELGALAAAYAEAGRFPEAIETEQKSIDTARSAGNAQLAAIGSQLLTLFRAGKPYHEPPATPVRPPSP